MAIMSGKSLPKPRIRKAAWSQYHGCYWKCTSGIHGWSFTMGLGKSPEQAYDDWLYNFRNHAIDKGD